MVTFSHPQFGKQFKGWKWYIQPLFRAL